MRMLRGQLWLVPACLGLCPVAQAAGPVVSTQVEAVDAAQRIVVFPVGREQGVALDDRFWVFPGENEVAWGRLYYVDRAGCGGRIEGGVGDLAIGAPAAITVHARIPAARDELPPGTTLHGTVQRSPPGRGVAWVDIGAWSGLRLGDSLLVERKSIPIARGEVSLLEDRGALAVLTPLLANARAEAGDRVRLWPSPFDRSVGRLDTVVMDVRDDGPVPQFRFVASDHEGLAPGRVGELYRGRTYIGLASVTDVGAPLSWAEADLEATLPAPEGRPRVGDRMVLRSAPPRRAIPLEAAVFRVERLVGEPHDYALIAAGEQDGVKPGDRLIVSHRHPHDRHLKKPVAELVVKTVKISYSGAEVHDLQPADDERVRPWDMAERVLPAEMRWENAGIVTATAEGARLGWADVDDRVVVEPGGIVRWESDPEKPAYAAVVVYRDRQRMALWIPPGWGPVDRLLNAGIDVRGALSRGDSGELEEDSGPK